MRRGEAGSWQRARSCRLQGQRIGPGVPSVTNLGLPGRGGSRVQAHAKHSLQSPNQTTHAFKKSPCNVRLDVLHWLHNVRRSR